MTAGQNITIVSASKKIGELAVIKFSFTNANTLSGYETIATMTNEASAIDANGIIVNASNAKPTGLGVYISVNSGDIHICGSANLTAGNYAVQLETILK